MDDLRPALERALLADLVGVVPKIIASTATVRRAADQCKALYGRNVRVFPPPGPTESETYFSLVDRESPGRRYLGVAASGRAMKALLLRTYVALLGAAQLLYTNGAEGADAFQTLVGYFNSLRELGGMRRLLEDDVRERSKGDEARRMPSDCQPPHLWLRPRQVESEPVELTSRQSTATIADAKKRLGIARGAEGSAMARAPGDLLRSAHRRRERRKARQHARQVRGGRR